MITNSVKRNALTIQEKAIVCGEFDRSDSKTSLVTVNSSAALSERCDCKTADRIFDAPEFRTLKGSRKPGFANRLGYGVEFTRVCGIQFKNLCRKRNACIGWRTVVHAHINVHQCGIFGDFWRGDKSSPMANSNRPGF